MTDKQRRALAAKAWDAAQAERTPKAAGATYLRIVANGAPFVTLKRLNKGGVVDYIRVMVDKI